MFYEDIHLFSLYRYSVGQFGKTCQRILEKFPQISRVCEAVVCKIDVFSLCVKFIAIINHQCLISVCVKFIACRYNVNSTYVGMT